MAQANRDTQNRTPDTLDTLIVETIFDLKATCVVNILMLVWFFSHLGFWSGNLFLIAPFPDLCLLVPFYIRVLVVVPCGGPKKSPRTSI